MTTCVIPIRDPQPLTGDFTDIPGDKSMSHRAIILGSLAEGRSTIQNFLMSQDCLNTIAIFKQLGVTIRIDATRKEVIIDGVGLRGLTPPKGPLNVGNAGTGIRLITGLLSAQAFPVEITGDASIQTRPMKRIIDPLSQMGADIDGQRLEGRQDIYPPLHIRPVSQLSAVHYHLPVASAQVKSAILLAGLYASGDTTVTEPSPPSRDHSELWLQYFGAQMTITAEDRTLHTPVSLHASSDPIEIPSDISSAAFFIVLAVLTPGSDVTFKGVSLNPTRTAVLDVLIDMGADIDITPSRSQGPEKMGDIRVKASSLQNGEVSSEQLPFLIDEVPILSVAAAFASGTFKIRDAEELRVKESDRIAGIEKLMHRLGVPITVYPDGFEIEGCGPDGLSDKRPFSFNGGHDHRMAMSAAIAALLGQRDVSILGAETIRTSFPNFIDCLHHWGIKTVDVN